MSRYRTLFILLLGLLLASGLLTSGCGNKGPLYLPDRADQQNQ